MVWQLTVNQSLFGASRFDPYHLHQYLARSYKGYYFGLSIRLSGFDSPSSRQFDAGRVWSPAWSHKPLPSLVRIQVPLPVLGFIQQFKNFTVNEKKANPVVLCASGGMVYTLVLEANAERIESSSLSLRTILK